MAGDAVHELRHEAATHQQLSHPNVLAFYGACVEPGKPLRNLVNLQELILSASAPDVLQFTGDLGPLSRLVHLSKLDLRGCCNLTGTLEPLRALDKLRNLDLRLCSKLTGIADFKQSFPECKV